MIHELAERCRSYRAFASGVCVPRETLLSCIDTARIASATRNLQPLKYRLVTTAEECARVLACVRFAASLPVKLPPVGHEPTAYIVICHDTSLAPDVPMYLKDVGICAELIMLRMVEEGFGGCMIGSASEALSRTLSLPAHLVPKLVLALGKPDETVVLTEPHDGDVDYFRDENNVHYVPKRALDDIIIDA
ncbi:MAG: nitroreductase [Ruminococcaceae bacterium]|nr:nitroreductase [Oscillospiraceae bacterium]